MREPGGDVSDRADKIRPETTNQADLNRRIEAAQEYKPEHGLDARKLSADERARIERFRCRFGHVEGADHVILDAEKGNAKDRMGALHQMDVAEELADQIARFEEPIHPLKDGESARWPDKVDMVTKDCYAIECKSTSYSETYPSQLSQDALEQAEKRLRPNAEGKVYKDVIVVFEDGKLSENMRDKAAELEAQNPGIHFCEKSEVRRVLKELRLGKR